MYFQSRPIFCPYIKNSFACQQIIQTFHFHTNFICNKILIQHDNSYHLSDPKHLFRFLEPDWGLPLAIAANLHVPYRIKLGVDNLDAIHVKDHNKKGKNF